MVDCDDEFVWVDFCGVLELWYCFVDGCVGGGYVFDDDYVFVVFYFVFDECVVFVVVFCFFVIEDDVVVVIVFMC